MCAIQPFCLCRRSPTSVEKLSYFPLAAVPDTATCFHPSEAKALVPGEKAAVKTEPCLCLCFHPFILGKGSKGGVKGGNCLPDTERETSRQLAKDRGVGTMPARARASCLWPGLQGDTGDILIIERTMVESAGPVSGWDPENCGLAHYRNNCIYLSVPTNPGDVCSEPPSLPGGAKGTRRNRSLCGVPHLQGLRELLITQGSIR